MLLTEPVELIDAFRLAERTSIQTSTSDKPTLDRVLGAGASNRPAGDASDNISILQRVSIIRGESEVMSFMTRGDIPNVAVSASEIYMTYKINLSSKQEISRVNSYYAVYTPPRNESERVVEDCRSRNTKWYNTGAIRTESRSTPCYSQVAIANPLEAYRPASYNDRVDLVFNEPIRLSDNINQEAQALAFYFPNQDFNPTEAVLSDDRLTLTLISTVARNNRNLIESILITLDSEYISHVNEPLYETTLITLLPQSAFPVVSEVAFVPNKRFHNVKISFVPSFDLTPFHLSTSTPDIIDRILFKDRSGTLVSEVDGGRLEYIKEPQPALGTLAPSHTFEFGFSGEFPVVANSGDITATFIFDNLLTFVQDLRIRPLQTNAMDVPLPDNVAPIATYFPITLTLSDDQSGLTSGQIRYDLFTQVTFNELIMTRGFGAEGGFEQDVLITAWDINNNYIDQRRLTELRNPTRSFGRIESNGMALSISALVVAEEEYAYYGIRLSSKITDLSKNPIANRDTPQNQRTQIVRSIEIAG